MDDIDSKIAQIKKEVRELDTLTEALGRRLSAGEDAVRAELNPAIRRRRELGRQLHELEVGAGRYEEMQTMYGPPWEFGGGQDPPPAPMYGPPVVPPIGGASHATKKKTRGFLRRLLGLK